MTTFYGFTNPDGSGVGDWVAKTRTIRHAPQMHGPMSREARKRGEEWLSCTVCGQPRHRFQAAPRTLKEEDRGEFWWLLVGSALAAPTIFVLIFTAFLLAVPGPVK